ncbi:hypothetical protein ACOSZF_19730 [Cytobacillus firmus]|uniref:Uncharacterized protein n=1 Tax=Cytobacillus firmus TaxID=1399 RepID=A0A380XFH5_CYTFI|nr:hypothetical protein [Cytobacillus firmus]KAF0823196.1 hypothetical protein KIS1582_3014 [Cytobacillus firmus]MDD9313773.1 hypothetical protein [Cytobacillus firmus]MEC1891589.1 hypothetical protein [Cytobacillus firmus]MED1907962.1 hypothetical protein [Cytobacillus firmus]MED1939348.1 hypothetical protein [Cytobacillus firmus]
MLKKSKRILLSLFAILICLGLFVIGILFAGKMPFLTVLGIAGLSGIYYVVFRLVKTSAEIEK